MLCTYTYFYRVAYCDTDNMGYLHHSNYIRIYESARWEMFRNKGISYKKIEDDGYMIPVIDVKLTYKLSAAYDDLLRVETKLEKCIGAKMLFSYEIYNEKNDLLNTATISVCFVNKDTRKATRMPHYIYELISQ